MSDPRDPDGLVTSWAKSEAPKPPPDDDRPGTERIPAPFTMAGLRELPEPEERWLVEGLIPHDANSLWAGYPKTYKTLLVEELAVALASATPFLGRFRVPERKRVGLVLMEDAKHRTRRRVERIADAHGLTTRDLDGWLFFWFRPPLRFSSKADMSELGEHVREHALDYLHVDSWAYVNSGNSNDADDVAPQLAAFSGLRDVRDGLTVGLTHHAKKASRDQGGDRLADHIRNSTHFPAWYDVGLLLSRSDETAPVKVRCEMRDLPSLDPFMFTVEDQHPAGPDTGIHPTGWLRLQASTRNPAVVEREAQAARFVPAVREYLTDNSGCSKEELKRGITGDNSLILTAFDSLCETGHARYVEPPKRGMAGSCELTPLNPAVTPLAEGSETNPADPAVTPVGGTGGAGVSGSGSTANDEQRGGSPPEFTCLVDDCNNEVGGPHARCGECIKAGRMAA